jgi:hypothetical protein
VHLLNDTDFCRRSPALGESVAEVAVMDGKDYREAFSLPLALITVSSPDRCRCCDTHKET